MVHFLKNSVSSFLIGLLIFSTTPLTVSKHFCQNKLKSISFLNRAKTCCQTNSTHQKGLNESPCCHIENSFLQGNISPLKTVDFQIKKGGFDPIKNNGTHTALNFQIFLHTVKNNTVKKIPPPRPLQNFQALFQVYRI